jgi:hypothetical protein
MTSGEQGGCGMTVILFLARQKNEVSSCAYRSSACQVFFVTHFPAYTEMCHCSNIGLQFVLLEQIYNMWLCECQLACCVYLGGLVLRCFQLCSYGGRGEQTQGLLFFKRAFQYLFWA